MADRITNLKIDATLRDQQQALNQIQALAQQMGATAERCTLLWQQYAALETEQQALADSATAFQADVVAMLEVAAPHMQKLVTHVALGTGKTVAEVLAAITPE